MYTSHPPANRSASPQQTTDHRPHLRSKNYPEGRPDIPNNWVNNYIQRHNAMARATIRLIKAAHNSGTAWGIENPADRGDKDSPAHWGAHQHQGTLWDILWMHGIKQKRQDIENIRAHKHTFRMCTFGAVHQEYTTIWCSMPMQGNSPHTHKCPQHSIHPERLRGNHRDGSTKTSKTEAFPPAMTTALAAAITLINIDSKRRTDLTQQGVNELADLTKTHE